MERWASNAFRIGRRAHGSGVLAGRASRFRSTSLLLSAINEVVGLPLGFYSGFVLERRYELSNESLGAWLLDRVKAFAIGVVLGGGSASLVYWCIRVSPERWWLSPAPSSRC